MGPRQKQAITRGRCCRPSWIKCVWRDEGMGQGDLWKGAPLAQIHTVGAVVLPLTPFSLYPRQNISPARPPTWPLPLPLLLPPHLYPPPPQAEQLSTLLYNLAQIRSLSSSIGKQVRGGEDINKVQPGSLTPRTWLSTCFRSPLTCYLPPPPQSTPQARLLPASISYGRIDPDELYHRLPDLYNMLGDTMIRCRGEGGSCSGWGLRRYSYCLEYVQGLPQGPSFHPQ